MRSNEILITSIGKEDGDADGCGEGVGWCQSLWRRRKGVVVVGKGNGGDEGFLIVRKE